jgi:hypothetical protein
MSTIKTIGQNGQISLGKEYAGRSVLMDELEPGVWILKLGQFIPDNERWLHTPESQAKIDEALAWAAENPPRDNFAEIEAAVDGH